MLSLGLRLSNSNIKFDTCSMLILKDNLKLCIVIKVEYVSYTLAPDLELFLSKNSFASANFRSLLDIFRILNFN